MKPDMQRKHNVFITGKCEFITKGINFKNKSTYIGNEIERNLLWLLARKPFWLIEIHNFDRNSSVMYVVIYGNTMQFNINET